MITKLLILVLTSIFFQNGACMKLLPRVGHSKSDIQTSQALTSDSHRQSTPSKTEDFPMQRIKPIPTNMLPSSRIIRIVDDFSTEKMTKINERNSASEEYKNNYNVRSLDMLSGLEGSLRTMRSSSASADNPISSSAPVVPSLMNLAASLTPTTLSWMNVPSNNANDVDSYPRSQSSSPYDLLFFIPNLLTAATKMVPLLSGNDHSSTESISSSLYQAPLKALSYLPGASLLGGGSSPNNYPHGYEKEDAHRGRKRQDDPDIRMNEYPDGGDNYNREDDYKHNYHQYEYESPPLSNSHGSGSHRTSSSSSSSTKRNRGDKYRHHHRRNNQQ